MKYNSQLFDNIRSELYHNDELCGEILAGASDDALAKVLFEKGSDFIVGIVGGDCNYYEWLEEDTYQSRDEEDAMAYAREIVSSKKYPDYTVVVLQIPCCIQDDDIDADTFEIWREYIPELSIDDIDEETVEKFRKSFKNFFDDAHPNDYDSDEEIAWAWATDVDDVEIPEYFCDEDGNVEDEDELSDYLYQLALDFLEERK